MQKLLILGLGPGKYKMSLYDSVLPEIKEVLENRRVGGMSKGHSSQPEGVPDAQRQNGLRKT